MSLKTRKLLCLLVLLVGLPIYIVASIWVISLFERPSFLVEILVYVVLGILWALPFRSLFRGVARADPADGASDPR